METSEDLLEEDLLESQLSEVPRLQEACRGDLLEEDLLDVPRLQEECRGAILFFLQTIKPFFDGNEDYFTTEINKFLVPLVQEAAQCTQVWLNRWPRVAQDFYSKSSSEQERQAYFLKSILSSIKHESELWPAEDDCLTVQEQEKIHETKDGQRCFVAWHDQFCCAQVLID